MRPEHNLRIAASTLFMLFAGTAAAQIDHRVNRGNVGGTGRALDANPAYGSSGLNQPNPYVTDFGARSNALISGNLTGLAGFKGASPIPTGNGFRLSLPSSGLSSFYGTSVGIPDVRSGGVPLPTYYYGREQTIADLSYIQQGLNQPGSSQLRSTETAPQLVTPQRIEDYGSAIPDPVDLRVDVDRQAQLNEIGVARIVRPDGANAGIPPSAGVRTPYEEAVGSSLFGIPDVKSVLPSAEAPVDTARLLDVTGRRLSGEQQTQLDTAAAVEPLDTRVVAETPTYTGEQGQDDLTSRDSTPVRDAPQVSAGFEVTVRRPGELPPEPEMPAAIGEARLTRPTSPISPAQTGLDPFHDMVRAIRAVQSSGAISTGIAAQAAEGSEQEATQDATESEDAARATRSAIGDPNDLASSLKWASGMLESPITSFAGAHVDDFNRYMLAGEEALRDGRYYDSERQFDLAHIVQPDNPLPLLHRGHALIAAGDFTSASRALQEGIRRFPQIAAFRIDLPAMAGNTTIFDIRRADLEKSLARVDHYELRFLLGYLELYSGLVDLGIENLELAAKAAPPDSVIADFADLVLGRKPLPEMP